MQTPPPYKTASDPPAAPKRKKSVLSWESHLLINRVFAALIESDESKLACICLLAKSLKVPIHGMTAADDMSSILAITLYRIMFETVCVYEKGSTDPLFDYIRREIFESES